MITLTEPAASKVRQLIEQEGDTDVALRLAVRPGGCSGFSYEMFFDREVDEGDWTDEFYGVKVAVDPQSMEMIRGAEVDYVDGLQASGFKISNPNQSRSCGCGQSFC
ncbi:MAG: HesB/IscA family protein [Acidimicrobiia bacterium]